MKAYRSFTVRPSLPEALRQLQPLAMNLRWAWDERTQDLFRWVDLAEETDRVLGRHRLEELAADRAFGRSASRSRRRSAWTSRGLSCTSGDC